MPPASPPPLDAPTLRAPATLGELFWAFNRMALQGFGGVLAVAQRELVERLGWLTRDQFVEMLSIGQVLPGPNIVNLALMIGDRFFGWRGAAAALAGMLTVPLVLVLALAVGYNELARYPLVSGALRGMGAVAAGLVIATGLKLLPSLRINPMGPRWCVALLVATFLAIAWWRWPLVWAVFGIGGVGVVLAWRRLR